MNFNPRSPHGERQFRATFQGDPEQISTHAPRTGSDFDLFFAHAVNGRFQPTLPARGATRLIVSSRLARRISTHAPRTGSDEGCSSSAGTSRHFNPRSPHGERRHAARLYDGAVRFQSTLPARGATIYLQRRSNRLRYFNPRSPHGERLQDFYFSDSTDIISIHAPRTGSDKMPDDTSNGC